MRKKESLLESSSSPFCSDQPCDLRLRVTLFRSFDAADRTAWAPLLKAWPLDWYSSGPTPDRPSSDCSFRRDWTTSASEFSAR